MRILIAASVLLLTLLVAAPAKADPDATVRTATQVLNEVMAIPISAIPEKLLAEAQGIAIIPDVLKIGFIAGIRRGHGVVLVRDPNGAWSLPQFVTLTGGSIGWQAGVQGTDVILVFVTRKSVDGLLNGKFTIGADAAAAAGPVGRNAMAATDARLKAEILSYSRSRGLFAGLALDGSVIEINPVAQTTYYGAGPGQNPVNVPESAAALLAEVNRLTNPAGAPTVATAPPANVQTGAGPPTAADGANTRKSLADSSTALQGIMDQTWREFLALPKEVYEGSTPPSAAALQQSLRNYDRVANDPQYQSLTNRPEFQKTYKLLREYSSQLTSSSSSTNRLTLPPPPR
jgi:lipid-binding SYLF domain-containing protein